MDLHILSSDLGGGQDERPLEPECETELDFMGLRGISGGKIEPERESELDFKEKSGHGAGVSSISAFGLGFGPRFWVHLHILS